MTLRKSLAIWAACAALGITGAARAESASDQLTLQPVKLQTEETRRPFMALLNEAGLATPLEDAGITIGGYANAAVNFYANRGGAADPTTGAQEDFKNQVGRTFDSEDQDPTFSGFQVFVDRPVELGSEEVDVGFRMEWLYGGDARYIHSTGLFDHYGVNDGPDEQFDLTQLYVDVALPVGNGLNIKLGKFVALSNYEVIDATKRPLYSVGYIFAFASPGTHTGVLATYKIDDQCKLDFGIIRGWESSLEDNNGSPSGIARYHYVTADNKVNGYLTLIVGPEQANDTSHYRTFLDFTGTYAVSDQITTAINAVYAYDSGAASDGDAAQWYGLGAWASWTLSDYFTANGRLEWFNDTYGSRGLDTNIWSATAGVTITPFPTDSIGSNLKLRPELRYDYADNQIFGDTQNSLLSVGIEAYFTF